MNRKSSMRVSLWVACILIALPMFLSGFASADATLLVKGQTYDFYTADGGADSGTGLFSMGKHTEALRKAEAMSQCIIVGYGQSGWGEVWKTVNSGSSTYYSTLVEGTWWCVVSASGGAYAEIYFNLRVKNLDTGTLVYDSIITHIQTAILWAHNMWADFSIPFTWYGTAGVHYGIEVFVLATTGGGGLLAGQSLMPKEIREFGTITLESPLLPAEEDAS